MRAPLAKTQTPFGDDQIRLVGILFFGRWLIAIAAQATAHSEPATVLLWAETAELVVGQVVMVLAIAMEAVRASLPLPLAQVQTLPVTAAEFSRHQPRSDSREANSNLMTKLR